MNWSRAKLSGHIAQRLMAERGSLSDAWHAAAPISHFIVDDLVPREAVHSLSQAFPDPKTLMRRNTWRERKRVGIQVSEYEPIVGEFLYAFQSPDVCRVIEAITGIDGLEPDPSLYASGISTMGEGDFLNPHLDNSHDGDNDRYRALNLLFYATPDFGDDSGGELEMWNESVTEPTAVSATFNRLVVMSTHPTSWHSVRRVIGGQPRQCVSNYYFSAAPPLGKPYSHVTTFAGRPEQTFLRPLMRVDAFVLNTLGRLFPFLTTHNPHRRRDPE